MLAGLQSEAEADRVPRENLTVRYVKRSPQWLDARTLEMHQLMVEKIRKKPDLFAILGRNLAHWRQTASPSVMTYLDAWQTLVDEGPEACFRVALEDSEYGKGMRQSSPFAGVLTNRERWAFLQSWEAHEAS